ncbi:hypothetical protein ACHAXH_005392 [Discostella pseudostelligera]
MAMASAAAVSSATASRNQILLHHVGASSLLLQHRPFYHRNFSGASNPGGSGPGAGRGGGGGGRVGGAGRGAGVGGRGFQGRGGSGRDGGGRGPGGPHRAPQRRGAAPASGNDGGEGGGSTFSALLARRNAALAHDLENARRETALQAAASSSSSGFSGERRPPVRVHRQESHPGNSYEESSQRTSTENHHRASHHRGGPPKSNFAEHILRPASIGQLSSSSSSGIPKLAARKRLGHQVHDEEKLESARPAGQRRSGRSAVRGEMMGNRGVLGDLAAVGSAAGSVGEDRERESGMMMGEEEGMLPPSGLRDMMIRRRQQQQQQQNQQQRAGGGVGDVMMIAPIRERTTRFSDRRRSLDFLRGNLSRGGAENMDGYDSEDEKVLGDVMQKDHLQSSLTSHWASRVDNQDGDGYDSDADLEPYVSSDDPDYMDLDNHEHVRKNDAGEYIFDYDAMDYEALMKLKEEGYYDQVGDPSGRTFRVPPGREDEDDDPLAQTFEYDYYFRDVTNLQNPLLLKPSKPDSNALLPLKAHGPELDDFLLAVTDHPSKYAVIEQKAKHPDSRREPRPIFARGNVLPDEEFVKKYKGYLYVTGLVPHLDEITGEVLAFDDALHKQSIAEDVAKLFGRSSMDVSPASPTSAYIGFGTKLEAKKAMMDSAVDGRLNAIHSVKLQKYEQGVSDEEEKFVVSSPAGADSILKVTGLPATVTSVELLTSMFPPGSRLEEMFGQLNNANYLRVSSTTALISLASSDLVAKALKSSNIANNVAVVGKRPIQVLRAKRERVFDNWTGVNKSIGASKLGNRLFVTGDVPPHEMYLSHNDTLHISGLTPSVTLNDLATFFQPFSADRRDVFGSGHIVRCSQGIPTGCAYIGFELPGEIDQVREVYTGGKAMIGGCEVTFRSVRDKLLRRGRRETARPSRSIDELHSDLYDWERHVDPKDIAELEKLGIEKGVLDEIMLTMRHHNRTFAAGDQSILGERLYEKRQVGTHYRDVVRKYLKVLKSCVGTREDPGLMYEAMFRPDEEVDMGLFDIEEERIKDLRNKGV